jgi:phosphopantetheine--protein transferase-like protein
MDEIVCCGIDIEEISRFRKFISFPDRVEPFITSVFTLDEINRSLAFGSLLPFAIGFSCKEAVFKAFGISWTNSSIKWQEVELLYNGNTDVTQFQLRLSGYARQLFEERGYNFYETYAGFTDEFVIFKFILLKKFTPE